MNMSKTKVMMEIDTQIYVNNTQIENVRSRSRSTWDRDKAPEKTMTRRFKEQSWPDGQHSPNTATSSRVT